MRYLFKNLAGVVDCDRDIERELTRARIDLVHGTRIWHEVPFSITGKLGSFTFCRAWHYWVVEGNVPLAVAQELYGDPVGREDVRVSGHCGCPAPGSPWVTYLDESGRKLIDRAEMEKDLAGVSSELKTIVTLPSLALAMSSSMIRKLKVERISLSTTSIRK